MRASNEKLTLLSEAEQSALYDHPDFDDDQRITYLTFNENEKSLMFERTDISSQLYCALQIGYFKAKNTFFNFQWPEVPEEDINFIWQNYFCEYSVPHKKSISEYEYYTQRKQIALLFGYKLWSKQYTSLLHNHIIQLSKRDTSVSYILTEIIVFLNMQKIVRPGYTTLQTIMSSALTSERRRLAKAMNKLLGEEEKSDLNKLLIQKNSLSELAALKQDAKNFNAHMMVAEREKLATIKPFYQIAKVLLPQLDISKQNIQAYSELIHYYSIHDLRKRIKIEQTYLYLLCYIWRRYQQLTDNLIDAFFYHLKQFDQENKAKAKEAFYQHQKQEQNEQILMRRFANCFIDVHFPNDIYFGDVRKQAFKLILPEDELRNKLSGNKPTKEMDFRWEHISKLGYRFKNHLRPLVMALDFSSIISNNPWLNAINWFKSLFQNQKSLNQQPIQDCPEGTIPKRLRAYLLELDKDGNPIKLEAERYEFWIYRTLKKRLQAGDLYLEDSIYHQSLNEELVSLEKKDEILKQFDIPALRQPIEKLLDEKFAELHELWIAFNDDLKKENLKHLRYDEEKKTLHLRKSKAEKEEELQQRFYAQIPICDIADVLQFVNKRCNFLSAFTHIQPRYSKQPPDKKSLMAVIMAQAMNHGNLNMAEICDIPYHILQDTYQSRVRLSTLKDANDLISNDIARMPIFQYYSLDLNILYGGVDGQKYEVEHPTTKARNSKKYFKKGKGVVAYTLLANHIPLQTELIGAHEHESYFVFDIWYNNTADVMPDVVTGDMHCINKGNFAIMDWFGGKLFPRFTDIEAQRKHLYCGRDSAEYKDCLIQPAGQIDRKIIEEDWLNQQRVIATLALKEMKQSTLVKKLCTCTYGNPTRKAFFEYDKLIRSIHTLKYLRDPNIQQNTHRSQNRVESYHYERAAIAQVGGRKQLAGRTDITIEISNQCGRLLANAINHYNSAILSKFLEKYEKIGNKKGLAILKKIPPVAWDHIHFQGHFRFADEISIDLDEILNSVTLK